MSFHHNYTKDELEVFLARAKGFLAWLKEQEITKVQCALYIADPEQTHKCFCIDGARIEYYREQTNTGRWIQTSRWFMDANVGVSLPSDHHMFGFFNSNEEREPRATELLNNILSKAICEWYGFEKIPGRLVVKTLTRLGYPADSFQGDEGLYSAFTLNDNTEMTLTEIAVLQIDFIKELIAKSEV